ncbi:MAG: TRAP transporter substrate-binding protein [Betaproteobacteria bacterium]|nr:TRAP transporter substrate-binding protein [Betaproteobacteria bacterium]
MNPEFIRTSARNMAAALAAGLLAAGAAHAQQFTMKLSSPTVNDVQHEWMKAFKTGVEARVGGRIKVEIYPANQLGQIPRTVEGVALGTIELTAPAVGFLVGLEPRFEVFDAPGLFEDVRHGHAVFADPEIRKRVATFGAAKGVEPLYVFLNGPLMLLSHKQLRSLNDFKGQKIRVPGPAPLHIEPFRKLGASPVSMPLGEALPAMQNRTIDGSIAAFSVFTAFKYYDVAKGLTQLPKSFLVAAGLVNRNFMKSLGPELETIVRDEARKAEAVFSTWGVDEVERIRKNWEANGGQIITLSPADTERYVEDVTSVAASIVAKNPRHKEDYEALLAAAKKYRNR